MLHEAVEKELRLWKAIYQQFPNAEIIRLDGSRKKLSEIFDLADDRKTPPAVSCHQQGISFQQLSFDFKSNSSKRGAI